MQSKLQVPPITYPLEKMFRIRLLSVRSGQIPLEVPDHSPGTWSCRLGVADRRIMLLYTLLLSFVKDHENLHGAEVSECDPYHRAILRLVAKSRDLLWSEIRRKYRVPTNAVDVRIIPGCEIVYVPKDEAPRFAAYGRILSSSN